MRNDIQSIARDLYYYYCFFYYYYYHFMAIMQGNLC